MKKFKLYKDFRMQFKLILSTFKQKPMRVNYSTRGGDDVKPPPPPPQPK